MAVGFYSIFFLVIGFSAISENVNPYLDCDLELMNSFKLTGMKHPTKERLNICMNVEHNCCTMVDELAIVKFWRDYTSPKIARFANIMSGIYQRLFNFQKYISKIDFENIMVHYTTRSWFQYNQTICSLLEENKNTTLWNTEQHFLRWNETRETRSDNNLLQIYLANGFDNRKLFLKSLTNEQNITLKNVGVVRKRFDQAVRKAMKRLKLDVFTQNQENQNLAENLSEKFAEESRVIFPRKLKQFFNKQSKSIKKLSSKNEETQKKFFENAHELMSKEPIALAEKAQDFQNFFRLVKKHLIISRKAQQKAISSARRIVLPRNRQFNRMVNRIISNPRLPALEFFNVPMFMRDVENFDPIRSSETQCSVERRQAFRTFVRVNRPKYEHCVKVHENMKIIDNMNFDKTIIGIRETIVRVLDMKKTLYCAICDADSHKYFNSAKDIVMLDEHFCRDIIGVYRDYIEFANVIMIQFGEQLLQYIECMNSLPNVINVPFLTRFEFQKRNIFFFRKCFDNVLADDYMRHCHFICSTFNFDSFSKYIDGDLRLLYNVYLEIIDFTRNNNIPFDTSLIVNNEFLESLNNDFYSVRAPTVNLNPRPVTPKVVTPITQQNVNQALNSNFTVGQNGFIAENFTFHLNLVKRVYETVSTPVSSDSEIFSRIKKTFSLQNARYLFFENSIGLNPLSLLSSAFLQMDSDIFIQEYYKKLNHEKAISSSTIQSFFALGLPEINAFNVDIDMDFVKGLNFKNLEEDRDSIDHDLFYSLVAMHEPSKSVREASEMHSIF